MRARHSDFAIAKRLLAGDERAFRQIFDDYFPKLYRFSLARLGGNRDAATEIVQQTFCKAFQHIRSYRGEAALFTWMCRICRNEIADANRKLAREATSTLDDDALENLLEVVAAPAAAQPEQLAARHELIDLIQATLDVLPNHYGDVLEWKYVEGETVMTIAARLGLGQKAAESLLTRARLAFREALQTLADTADLLGPAGDEPSGSR